MTKYLAGIQQVELTAYPAGNQNVAIQGTPAVTISGAPTIIPQGHATTGGATLKTVVSAATTNGQTVKTSAGQVYAIQAGNTGASPAFLKLYNKTSGALPATDTPVLQFMIPAGQSVGFEFTIPAKFATGIAMAIVRNAPTNDNTAIGANEVTVNILYV